jgi:preprotein translocase subunit SecA
MVETVKGQIVSSLMRVRVVREDDVERMEAERRRKQEQELLRMNRSSGGEPEAPPKPVRREGDKTGRNALCPCGSGKKYKRCCGQET